MNRSLSRIACRGVFASLVVVPLLTASAYAADMTQQERMSMCSKMNKGKKGDDYKKSQSDCLKGGDTTAAAPMTQQQKMAACSRQNKGKKGDDYKKSQSDCLRG